MSFDLDHVQAVAITLQSELMPNANSYSESPPSSPESGHQREAPVAPSRVRKRVVTAARREQNKAAQRAYRNRQRERRKCTVSRNERPRELAAQPLPSSPSDGQHRNLQIEHIPVPDCQTGTAPANNTGSRTGTTVTLGADPLANTLQTTRDTIWLAVLHNALFLGFDLAKLAECSASYISPFYRPITANDSPRDLVASSLNTSFPIHLQPTMAQILIPHHASLDLIPLPLLRERAIMMTFAMPDIFDLWDLKLDIYTRHALVCRRYLDNGDCHPWESKSWEAKPWFMQKWSMAIEG